MDKIKINKITKHLLNKRFNKYYIDNSDLELVPNSQEEAYLIQNKVHSLLNSDFDRPVGKKIGCTTNVMQSYLKIDHPCAGTIRKSNCYKSGCSLNTKKYIKVGVECEIAVKLAKNLPFSESYKKKDIYEYVESVFPAIEIVDDRYSNWEDFTANHLIADDFFSSGCILGSKVSKVDFNQLDSLKGNMYINKKKIGEGLTSHILGHPLNALVWLSGRRDIIGSFIPKNSIILLGSLVETYWVSKGDLVTINIEGMESISVNFV